MYNKVIEQFMNDEEMIEKYNHAGIYVIKIENIPVYVGKSIGCQYRIGQHIRRIMNPDLKESKENKYVFLREARSKGYEITFDLLYRSRYKRTERVKRDIGEKEGVYIRMYMPCLNYQIPKEENWHKFNIQKTARTITFEEWKTANCLDGKEVFKF